jgi:hypothetical protein
VSGLLLGSHYPSFFFFFFPPDFVFCSVLDCLIVLFTIKFLGSVQFPSRPVASLYIWLWRVTAADDDPSSWVLGALSRHRGQGQCTSGLRKDGMAARGWAIEAVGRLLEGLVEWL